MLQLGIQPQDDYDDDDITVEQAWNDIVERIKYIFSDEVSSSKAFLHFHMFVNVSSLTDYWSKSLKVIWDSLCK